LNRLGHQRGDLVAIGGRHAESARHIADATTRLELVHGDDLADVVLAVLARDVLDDLLTAVHAEVDVEVGHGDALGVEEALEEQLVGDGIDIRDAHAVGDQRAGARAAARPHGDAVLLGVVDEIPDDEEVAWEVHLLDDPHLQLQPGAVMIRIELLAKTRGRGQAFGQALVRQLGQVGTGIVALGHLELRQVGLAQLELDVAHVADAFGVFQRLGQILEQHLHFLRRTQVVGVRRVMHALGIVDRGLHAHAHQDLVGARVPPFEIVAIVGGDDGNAGLLGNLDDAGVDLFLIGHAIGLHLQEVVAPAHDVVVLARHLLGLFHAAVEDRARHRAAQARGQGHQSLGVPTQQLPVDARVVIEALQKSHRVEVRQIFPTREVLGQKHQVVAAALGAIQSILGHVGFAAQDGLDPVGSGLQIEIESAEQVPMVGHGHLSHAQRQRLGEKLVEANGAIEQAVLGVKMQVREARHVLRLGLPVRCTKVNASKSNASKSW
jgi:hypothetical protein